MRSIQKMLLIRARFVVVLAVFAAMAAISPISFLDLTSPALASGTTGPAWHSTGSPTADLANGLGTNSNFGWSEAMSADGTTLLIGSPGTHTNHGVAYLFHLAKGASWHSTDTPVATLSYAGETGAHSFGSQVALSGNGTTALISYSSTDNHEIFLYHVTSENDWVNKVSPNAVFQDSTANTGFGTSLGLTASGTTAIVGAGGTTVNGKAFIYHTPHGTTWSSHTAPVATFTMPGSGALGASVALSSSGATAVVGARAITTYAGAAFVYHVGSSATWNSTVSAIKLSDQTATPGSDLGVTIALSADGSTALVGATGMNTYAGAAEVFHVANADTWKTSASPTAVISETGDPTHGYFGGSLAISGNGTVALIGNDNFYAHGSLLGHASLYQVATEASWKTTASPTALLTNQTATEASSWFAKNVALDKNGLVAAVGSSRAGINGITAVYDITVPVTPAAPSQTRTIADTTNEVTVLWAKVTGATSYGVYVATSPGTENYTSPPACTTAATLCTVTSLSNGTEYYFTVKAIAATLSSKPSPEVNATPGHYAPPLSPLGVSSLANNKLAITVSWESVTGATTYEVFEATSSLGENYLGPVVCTTFQSSCELTGLSNGTEYFFTVVAVNTEGFESLPSKEVKAEGWTSVLPAPATVQAQPDSGQITLTWSPVTGATSYDVFEATTPGGENYAGPFLCTTGASDCAAKGLTNGTPYCFTVVADFTATPGTPLTKMPSPPSKEVCATPENPVPVPPIPAGISATASSETVKISWDKVTGATSYTVFDSTSAGSENYVGLPACATSTAIFTCSIDKLTNGTEYFFTVEAVNGAGSSTPSVEVHATPVAPFGGNLGYWLLGGKGAIYNFGTAKSYGSPSAAALKGKGTVVALAPVPAGTGYYIATSTGAVFHYGSAKYFNSAKSPSPIIDMVVTAKDLGYWLVNDKGTVYSFGNASKHGSLKASTLGKTSVVGFAPTAAGKGYYEISKSGREFRFGNAISYGTPASSSLGGSTIAGFALMPTGKGYYEITKKGKVLAFGSAKGHGSVSKSALGSSSAIGLAITKLGTGYWATFATGKVVEFGTAKSYGTKSGKKLPASIVGMEPVA